MFSNHKKLNSEKIRIEMTDRELRSLVNNRLVNKFSIA